jgi:UDP-N-acetylglucosamine diphosphorylase / glucose-1-phosphate thymidylyltransferase / UDP-N-acetylgalactosamine diphosphorylase / glucosamine-1-phosphate N-acetyltransferase / galactosamine-1-phosphate N-acetyltransferase
MLLVVFEDAGYESLLPLVYSRATFNLRCGCGNLLDKTEAAFGRTAGALFVRPSLAAVIAERQARPVNRLPADDEQIWVNGRLLVRQELDLPVNSAVWAGDALLAARLSRDVATTLTSNVLLDAGRLRQALTGLREIRISNEAARLIDYPWQVVHENEAEIIRQAGQRKLQILGRVYPGGHLLNEPAIHLGDGSKVKPGAVLDAEDGPIVIGDNVTINPNATVTGPCYIADGCTIQPGASIRGPTSIGPGSRIGGEVEGTIVHAYLDKPYDGYFGYSYVGEWVNLGAGTVNSGLKNTAGPVNVAINGRPVNSGQTIVGSFIGDHTKTGICTVLPPGCVIGYACNVVLGRHVPGFVPSFSWLTDETVAKNDPIRALAVAKTVVARGNRRLSPVEEALFLSVAEESRRRERA